MSFLRERGMGASILVAALSSSFGVTLLATTKYLGFLAGRRSARPARSH